MLFVLFYEKKNCLLQNNLFYFGHIWFLIFSAKLIFGSFFCFMFDLLVSQRFVRFVCRFCEFIEQKFKFVTIIVFAASAQLWLHTIKKKSPRNWPNHWKQMGFVVWLMHANVYRNTYARIANTNWLCYHYNK